MPLFFLSYRRDDSAGYAGRLSDALELRFGDCAVFRDVDDIAPGAEFEQVIVERLTQVRGVLVLIGPRWLDASDEMGRRLERADDFVRREVELALQSGKPVIPVLVADAQMISAKDLPPSMSALAGRHASVLRDAAWRSDLQRLEQALADLPGVSDGGGGREWAPAALPAGGDLRSGHGRGRMVGAMALAAMLVAALSWWMVGPGVLNPAIGPVTGPVIEPATVAGVWTGRVDYPWGVSMDERFEFVPVGEELMGSAGYLGLPRAIESGRLIDGRLQFSSRTEVVSGSDPPRELTHRYVGTPEAGQIAFSLHTSGAGSAEPVVRFTVRRP